MRSGCGENSFTSRRACSSGKARPWHHGATETQRTGKNKWAIFGPHDLFGCPKQTHLSLAFSRSSVAPWLRGAKVLPFPRLTVPLQAQHMFFGVTFAYH